MKKYFLSVNACAPSNALIGATHCEVLENDEESDETAALSNAQNAKKQIKVGISAYFISKPSVSSVTVDYRDDAITITVFADQTPTSLGSYLYYSTETLNGEKYIGQPIRLDFKLTPAEDTNSES